MGNFTTVNCSYRKQFNTNFMQSGNDLSNVYEAYMIEQTTAGGTTTTTVPNGVSYVRIFIIGGGGSAGGGYPNFNRVGCGGGSAGFLLKDVAVSAGQSITLYTGRGGSTASTNTNGSAGENSYITIAGTQYIAGYGGGGTRGDVYTLVGGSAGGYSHTGIYNEVGIAGNGNKVQNYPITDPFSTSYIGNGVGFGSGFSNGYTLNHYTTTLIDNIGTYGKGGSSSTTAGGPGTQGYTRIHFLY